jgi:hypothetical protein
MHAALVQRGAGALAQTSDAPAATAAAAVVRLARAAICRQMEHCSAVVAPTSKHAAICLGLSDICLWANSRPGAPHSTDTPPSAHPWAAHVQHITRNGQLGHPAGGQVRQQVVLRALLVWWAIAGSTAITHLTPGILRPVQAVHGGRHVRTATKVEAGS